MRDYVTNPPWVDGPHGITQAWLRRVVHLNLLRHTGHQPVQSLVDDVVQEAVFKILAYKDREIKHGQVLLHSLDLEQNLILRLVHHLTLFLAALNVVRKALTFITVTPPRLVELRDKVKSLNLPIKLIPQSLHPAHTHHTHTSPVGG